ncbi:MAG: oligosaccharide flippase family protein [Clostridia bacterium]|nr:oligosaccharide flippase family protein [Clostridia bacterium]
MDKMKKTKEAGARFAWGVLFLTVSNVLTKLCGLFLRVPLTNMLGDTGMAYFNLAYAVYKWFYMISTAGLPVAAAVLCAQYAHDTDDPARRSANLRRVCTVTLAAFFTLGALGAILMALGADQLAALQHAPRAAEATAALAPALFCICISSALRGFYQGLSCQLPAAVAQVVEAAFKTICGLALGVLSMRRGDPIHIVAAHAISGLSVGCLCSMLVMLCAYPVVARVHGIGRSRERASVRAAVSRGEVLRALLRAAVPITLSASVMSLCDMTDSMTVIRRLCAAGVSAGDALAQYGSYTALAVPMFNLPPILIYPVTTALLPVLSSARRSRESFARIARGAVLLTVTLAMPCSAGMAILAKQILRLFYRAELCADAAPLLALLSPAIFFLSLLAITNVILQAAGAARYSLYSMLLGAAVKITSSVILCGMPFFGIRGVPLSTVLCYAVMALCNAGFVLRKLDMRLPFASLLLRPGLASLFCAVSARAALALPCFSGRWAVFAAIAIGGAVYLAVLYALGGCDPALLSLIGGGRLGGNRRTRVSKKAQALGSATLAEKSIS